MATKNRQWTLKSSPNGRAVKSDFEVVESEIPALNEGEILIKHQVTFLLFLPLCSSFLNFSSPSNLFLSFFLHSLVCQC